MRPEISRLIIKHFYQNKLKDDQSTTVDRSAYRAYMQVARELNLGGIDWAASEWPVSNILMVDMPDGTRTLSKTDSAGSKFNNGHIAIVRDICLTLLALDWPDRTVGLGPDWTGLILVRSGLEFWDRTVVQSPKKLGPDRRAVRSIFSRPDCLQSPKKLGPDCVAVQSQFLRLNGPSLGEKDRTGL